MEGAGTGPGSTRWDRSLGPAVTIRLCAPFPRPPGGSALARSCVLLALRFLALPLHRRLLVVLTTTSLGEDPALLDLLVEAAEGAFERLVLTHSDFGQSRFTSSGSKLAPATRARCPAARGASRPATCSARQPADRPPECRPGSEVGQTWAGGVLRDHAGPPGVNGGVDGRPVSRTGAVARARRSSTHRGRRQPARSR